MLAEPAPGRFTLNETAGRTDLAFTGLMHIIRTGQPAWETVFGAPFRDYLAADPALAAAGASSWPVT